MWYAINIFYTITWRIAMFFLYIQIKDSVFDIPWTLSELGIQVNVYEPFTFDPINPVKEEFSKLEVYLSENTYSHVISPLFVPEISDICQKKNIKYICWVYDSPLVSLFHTSITNPCNYIFIFDRAEYMHLQKWKIPHLYYLPLAANLSRTGTLDITEDDEKNFACDISFIGSLYEKNSYNSFISYLPEEIATEFKKYLLKNLCNWSSPKPWPRISEHATNYMIEHFQALDWKHFDMDINLFLGISFLSRKLAEMDRITVLNTLAQIHPIELYTSSDCSNLQGVHIHNRVDYYTDMSKIFYLSRINLNITLPSIETGIPQRIFDIMGVGGFVLTNYQAELEDLFVIGKEIEVFRDTNELIQKVIYYLSHEKERLQIAINGYKKVRDYYSYTSQMQKLLDIVNSEDMS